MLNSAHKKTGPERPVLLELLDKLSGCRLAFTFFAR